MSFEDMLRHIGKPGAMRHFDTGATRNVDANRFDYEGFLSPLAVESYAASMHKHRMQADGVLRDSDNWQRGMPKTSYIKSLFRHFFHAWKLHRGHAVQEDGHPVTMEEALCGVLFNAFGYLHEIKKEEIKSNESPRETGTLSSAA
jgi:hypothetical protein